MQRWPRAVAAAAIWIALICCASAVEQASTPMLIESKFDTATEQTLIRVRFNDAPLWCGLDSGFSALIAVDRDKAEREGLTAGRAEPTPDGAPPPASDAGAKATVRIGGLTFANQSLILRQLPAEAPDMDCILGVGLLRGFVVEFDHVEPVVRLYERGSYRPPPTARELPLVFRTNPNVPFIDVEVVFTDGTRQAARVLADTGASYYSAVFVSAFVENVRARIPVTARPANRPESTGGQIQLVATRPLAISVGPFSVSQPVVALLQTDLGSGGIDDGLLGWGFWRRFTVGFDFEGRRLYLTPNRDFDRRQTFDASGVGFRRRDGGYRVDIVLPDTPASRAGLRDGDTLVTIDGRAARDLTPVQLRDLLSRPGAVCDLGLDRGGAPVHVELRLESRL
jgi:hypothetical protein